MGAFGGSEYTLLSLFQVRRWFVCMLLFIIEIYLGLAYEVLLDQWSKQEEHILIFCVVKIVALMVVCIGMYGMLMDLNTATAL
mmetsp:Transcript_5171/g.7249  ORF Transcript_5171/g.7249 Transcript_5171/m.7249 type:complete len:83 (-) Transcript_5171:1010-1258(-)